MASTYSTNNRLELQADGENSGTWGQKTNTNLSLIDQLSSGYVAKSVAGSSNVTLTASNGASDEARNQFLKLTGALTGSIDVIVPAQSRGWTVWNATSGSFTLTFKPTGGTGLVIPQGASWTVWTDGSTMFAADNSSQNGTRRFATGSGTANVLTATFIPAFTTSSLIDGALIVVRPAATNTSTATLNVDSLGAAGVQKLTGLALAPNDLRASAPALLSWHNSSSAWDLLNHQGNLVLLQTQSFAAAASCNFTSYITSAYSEYAFYLDGVVPGTNNVNMLMRISEDAGSTWKTATGYNETGMYAYNIAAVGLDYAVGQNQMVIGAGLSNDATNGMWGWFHAFAPSGSTNKYFMARTVGLHQAGGPVLWINAGYYGADQGAVTGVQFFPSSGTITGRITMYGVRYN